MTILDCMEGIAKDKVKHFYSDFVEYDTLAYGRMYPDTEFIWVVREHGTQILGIPSRIQGTLPEQTDDKRINEIRERGTAAIQHYTDCYLKDKADFYYVKKDKCINKITAMQALKIMVLEDR